MPFIGPRSIQHHHPNEEVCRALVANHPIRGDFPPRHALPRRGDREP